jgi:hypothetical protein
LLDAVSVSFDAFALSVFLLANACEPLASVTVMLGELAVKKTLDNVDLTA